MTALLPTTQSSLPPPLSKPILWSARPPQLLSFSLPAATLLPGPARFGLLRRLSLNEFVNFCLIRSPWSRSHPPTLEIFDLTFFLSSFRWELLRNCFDSFFLAKTHPSLLPLHPYIGIKDYSPPPTINLKEGRHVLLRFHGNICSRDPCPSPFSSKPR